MDLERSHLSPSRTYPIDEKFQRLALESKNCQADAICRYISKNIRHVSFDQFTQALDRVADKLIESGALDAENGPYALTSMVGGDGCKSGLWVVALLLDKTRIGLDPKYHPALVTRPNERLFDFQKRAMSEGIERLVLVDDASYSGCQGSAALDTISGWFERLDIVIPFATERSLVHMKGSSPAPETHFWVDEIIPIDKDLKRTAVYFDHKMADQISTFPEVNYWISGCQTQRDCPIPPYKNTPLCINRTRTRGSRLGQHPTRGRDEVTRLQAEFLESIGTRDENEQTQSLPGTD